MVEFGCGYGTFTLPAAKLVTGRVDPRLDLDPDMVTTTCRKASETGLTNVTARVRDFLADGTGLADDSVGYAILFNILHVEDPVGLLREARRVLGPDGLAGIIHWRADISTPRGPSAPIRATRDECRAWAEAAGLEFVRDESLSCCSWHWGLVVRRPAD